MGAVLKFLHIGGLVAVGFSVDGQYLLAISHSGRGVFSTSQWTRLWRDTELCYPADGLGIGGGPMQGQTVRVVEISSDQEPVEVSSPCNQCLLHCASDGITIIHK